MAFGRLERTVGPPPMSDINMTPLIDVMLVLLVIFMLTAPLMVSAVKVSLPKAQGGQHGPVPAKLVLSIDPAGQVYLDDQALELDVLAVKLQQAAQANPLTEVQFRADATVSYGRVVEVMGLVHKMGLTRIGFLAEPVKQP